jgi:hypothetical protein
VAVLVVGVFSFIGITFINSVDNARVLSARTEWRNEAILYANRIISDPDCYGYIKTVIEYTNESGTDGLVNTRLGLPMTVDRNKLLVNDLVDIKRVDDCLRLRSLEYTVYIGLEVYEDGSPLPLVSNLDPTKYRNDATLQVVDLPVKIISDEGVSYGLIKFSISVSAEYFAAKLL